MTTAPDAMLPARAQADRLRLPVSRGQAPTPIQKAAIVLAALGPDLAPPLLRDLAEPDLKRFALTITGLGQVPQDLLDAVIVEFLEALTGGGDLSGGINAARRLLGGIFDDAEIARLLGEDRNANVPVWDRMNRAPLPALAAYLATEHPQTVAVVLSEMKADVAAAVLERLDRDFAQSIVLRLSRIPSLDQRVADALKGAIDRDFLSVLQRNLSKRRPAELIAGLMNNISSDAREAFLVHLESRDAELALDVQRTMFTFDDIAVRIAGRDIAATIRDIPDDVLLAALKLGQIQSSASVGFILENIPRRLAERYVEDLGNLPELSRKEGEAAQIELTKTILDKAKSGQLRLLEREGG